MTHNRAVLLMIVATLLWSMAGVVTRQLEAAHSFEVTFWRSAFNALALAVALTVIRGPRVWLQLMWSPRVVWISGVCWSVMFTAFMVAITLTSVANVLVMMAMGPLVTALFARIFLQHRLPGRTWGAIGVASVGIGWMFAQEAQTGLSLVGSLVAMVVPVAAAINFTTLQHVGHGVVDPEGKAPQDMLRAVFIGAVISALVTLPLASPLQASFHDVGWLAFLGAFQLALPCLLVVRASRKLSAPEIALLGLLEVIFGVTWAWLWASEQPTPSTLIGGALVLGALLVNELLALYSRRRAPVPLQA